MNLFNNTCVQFWTYVISQAGKIIECVKRPRETSSGNASGDFNVLSFTAQIEACGTNLVFAFLPSVYTISNKNAALKLHIVSCFSVSLDVDECKEIAFICGLDGICINKNGSYDCVCPEGQKPNPNDKRCEGR